MLSLGLWVVLAQIPFENALGGFETAEKAYRYAGINAGAEVFVVEGKNFALVLNDGEDEGIQEFITTKKDGRYMLIPTMRLQPTLYIPSDGILCVLKQVSDSDEFFVHIIADEPISPHDNRGSSFEKHFFPLRNSYSLAAVYSGSYSDYALSIDGDTLYP